MPDHHPQGGDLFDMAKDGTKGKNADTLMWPRTRGGGPNAIPSGEGVSTKKVTGDKLGSSMMDMPPAASTSIGELVSASGGELPGDVGQKYSRHGGKEREDKKSTPHGGRNLPSH
ncbi:hypothetical protein QBC44DRAFT_245807 [Cladorrhinum sp. PSN332]|nr:hypothetical protein QBC44DRAFT_245807 [Cladorrhinum sp. PSN332]